LFEGLSIHAAFMIPLLGLALDRHRQLGTPLCHPTWRKLLYNCSKNNGVVGGLLQRPHVVAPLLRKFAQERKLSLEELSTLSEWCPLVKEMLQSQDWQLQIHEFIVPLIVHSL